MADPSVAKSCGEVVNDGEKCPLGGLEDLSLIESSGKDAALSVERIGSSLKTLNAMAKRPKVDIEFQNVTYTVRNRGFSERRQILKGLSGKFKSGELTAILGPSGAGKSSLMNVLVGYTTAGVTGDISVNGRPREMRLYHKLSSYIMQDDLTHTRITVQEAMEVAAHLKLGSELGHNEKLLVVEEVLTTLGLIVCRHTRTEELSGGQRKRLAVALELVNNPPLIFLDEPTSGLDIVSIKQCIFLLKILANYGRTIVCTIHQPSASVFSLFDNVYFVAEGRCIYQGNAPLLVPFLGNLGFPCPTSHNPADFILETLQAVPESLKTLSHSIKNGETGMYCSRKEFLSNTDQRMNSEKGIIEKESIKNLISVDFPTSFLTQFRILIKRMLLQKIRNSSSLWIQLMHHIASGLLLGGIFYGIGNNGYYPITNFKFIISTVVFFMYTYLMIPILIFPTEVINLKREYFNRWYGLKAYYAAITLSGIPIMVALGFIPISITYTMSGQLLEIERFLLFSLSALLIGVCSEGFGLVIGSMFDATNGSVIGPALAAPSLAISIYGMGFGPKIEPLMKLFMNLSFVRFGATSMSAAIYKNRAKMDCVEDIFCLHADPAVLLRDLGLQDASYKTEILGLLIFTIFFRFLAYLVLRCRLQADLSTRVIEFFSKLLKIK